MYKSSPASPGRLEDPNTRECLSTQFNPNAPAGRCRLACLDDTETDQLMITTSSPPSAPASGPCHPEENRWPNTHDVICVESEFIGNGNDDTYRQLRPATSPAPSSGFTRLRAASEVRGDLDPD